jgi:SAM-dependent methyltransferase
MNIEDYARKHPNFWKDNLENPEIKFLLENNKFQKMIDIGCGNGNSLFSINKLGYLNNLHEVWGVNLSANRLLNVKK